MSQSSSVERVLAHYGASYRIVRRDPADRNVPEAQCHFLTARGRPVLVVLPPGGELDRPAVASILGEAQVRPADEHELRAWFPDVDPGAVPPLRLRGDLSILMDRGLARLGTLAFPAGNREVLVEMRFREWYRIVYPGVGRFAQPDSRRASGTTTPIILVVEDELSTNGLLCQFLERAGFVCHGATDGGRALALAAEKPPSAVLLDLMLPDMSGFELYGRLRSQGPLRGAPVVVLTALDDADTRERCFRLGAVAYLTKPVLPERLIEEISGALADARA